ncbi:MAG: McrC family protein [Bacteroidales bacterium]|nr:McrC family protein [Bacteroidales bacterium]MCF8351377.1 McrC family protein [Bacteroidales bacterium]MCF8377092.1 McrC family protein [Bacteroidales bacterium]
MKSASFIIKEFSYISCSEKLTKPESDDDGNIDVPLKTFEQIESFVLNNRGDENGHDDFLYLTQKGGRKILKARNYVGVLQTKNDTTIEILPKIHTIGKEDDDASQTKKIFLKMLSTLRDSPFKVSSLANLDLSRMPLLDVFINMFLDEIDILVKQGIRKGYIRERENLHTLKGKLNFNENIKHNLIHKERFFCEYDDFNPNRPENKLIKSTLLNVHKKSKLSSTQARARRFLFIFDEIDKSSNYEKDFAKCKHNRLVSNYEQILIWCRIFLQNKTFSSYKGDDLAFALLFPMEKIFEDFVAHELRHELRKEYSVRTQKIIGSLLTDGSHKMKPDILLEKNQETIIIDTKWKIPQKDKIAQSDLYQMFAYGTHKERIINDTKKIILIYPAKETDQKGSSYQFYNENDDLSLHVFYFELKSKEDYGKERFKSVLNQKE